MYPFKGRNLPLRHRHGFLASELLSRYSLFQRLRSHMQRSSAAAAVTTVLERRGRDKLCSSDNLTRLCQSSLINNRELSGNGSPLHVMDPGWACPWVLYRVVIRHRRFRLVPKLVEIDESSCAQCHGKGKSSFFFSQRILLFIRFLRGHHSLHASSHNDSCP